MEREIPFKFKNLTENESGLLFELLAKLTLNEWECLQNGIKDVSSRNALNNELGDLQGISPYFYFCKNRT